MKFFKKTFYFIVAAALIAAIYFFLGKNDSLEVRTEVVDKKPFLITVTATSVGTVKAEKEARITAQRIGMLTKLLFDEGSIVKNTDVIAEIDHEEAKLNMSLTEATLEKSKARLSELLNSLEVLKTAIDAEISRANAVLEESEKRLKRAMELFRSGFIPEGEVDTAEREYAVSKAAYDLALSKKKEIDSKGFEISAQKAQITEIEKSLSIARLNYNYSFIKPPIDGIITSREVKLGDTVQKGTMLGAVVSPDSLYVEGFIDEADIAKVGIGKTVNITMDAYENRIFKGKVYRLSPVVTGGKQETRTFETRIKFIDIPPSLKPGMSADIEIIIDRADDILSVPIQAVVSRNGKRFLFVVKDSKAKMTEVKIGRSNLTYIEITSGLVKGDEVIINADLKGLKDGSKVATKTGNR